LAEFRRIESSCRNMTDEEREKKIRKILDRKVKRQSEQG
jgi:hypothetical protein